MNIITLLFIKLNNRRKIEKRKVNDKAGKKKEGRKKDTYLFFYI
jgi:hypothetical protein